MQKIDVVFRNEIRHSARRCETLTQKIPWGHCYHIEKRARFSVHSHRHHISHRPSRFRWNHTFYCFSVSSVPHRMPNAHSSSEEESTRKARGNQNQNRLVSIACSVVISCVDGWDLGWISKSRVCEFTDHTFRLNIWCSVMRDVFAMDTKRPHSARSLPSTTSSIRPKRMKIKNVQNHRRCAHDRILVMIKINFIRLWKLHSYGFALRFALWFKFS